MLVSFGSLNHDLVLPVPRLPAPDETLAARGLHTARGGKGHNQATAAARLGAAAAMVGCVGDDEAGEGLRRGLEADGVDVRFVRSSPEPTGTAICLVADDGGGSIVIVAGANGTVSPELADEAAELLGGAGVLLLQGEVPVTASLRAARLAREGGGRVVFNPAPVREGAGELLPLADIVVANAGEAAALGLAPSDTVVITRGAAGALVGDIEIPAYPAKAVDGTGAGDAFVAGLAVAVGEGADLVAAARFGAAAGACATEVVGAEPSFPARAAVEARMGG